MKNSLLLPIMLLLVFSLQLSSCKKEDEKDNKAKFTVTATLNNDPVEGVKIHFFEETNGVHFLKTQTTNSQGKTVFKDLDPGKYSFEYDYLSPQGDSYGGGSDYYDLTAGENKQVTIELTDSN